MTRHAVIVDAVRSPMGKGKPGGGLSQVHAVELLAQVLDKLVKRSDLDPGTVDDVLIGCVSQVGEQSYTPGRMALLAAGWPEHVPSTTIDRKCGSSQQAVHFAAQGIVAGAYDIAVAGGIESMSRIPMGSARKEGQDPYGPSMNRRYAPGLVGQGVSAELVARKYQLTREEMDAFSARSHTRAAAARAAGHFDAEIVAIDTPDGPMTRDESIREGTTAEGLSELRVAFQNPEMEARYPDVSWSITAGNSSQITDGASALLIMSEEMATKLGLEPLARFVSYDVRGDNPELMLTAPIPSSRKALERAGMKVSDLDHIEVNEAFAPVPMSWAKDFGLEDDSKLNPCGGAIALGHPLGASGARIMTTMLHAMGRSGAKYGLQTMCEAGGMANTTIIERL